MNRRTIQRILNKKHEKFIESITDETVKELVKKNSIITGGAIASMLLGETVKDYDYYFTDMDTVKAVAQYYIEKFIVLHPDSIKPELCWDDDTGRVRIKVQSVGIVSEEDIEKIVTEADEANAEHMEEIDNDKGEYRPIFISANAITLSDKVQLVIRFYGNAEEIHKNYDFVHCCNYWTSSNNELVLNPTALESLLCKHLWYQGSLYPLCSVIRTRKFINAGWYINAGQYLKMCFQLSELNLSDINVLEDQLTGVDAAYFHQVIDYCKKRQEEDKEFKVTAPYLVSIIDKIFG